MFLSCEGSSFWEEALKLSFVTLMLPCPSFKALTISGTRALIVDVTVSSIIALILSLLVSFVVSTVFVVVILVPLRGDIPIPVANGELLEEGVPNSLAAIEVFVKISEFVKSDD
jgi:hypothetical protein